jgi:TPP-dependent 2-oxoacid decarboxylase
MDRELFEEVVADAKDYLLLVSVRDKIQNESWSAKSPLQESLLQRISVFLSGTNVVSPETGRPIFANSNVRLKAEATKARLAKAIRGPWQPTSKDDDTTPVAPTAVEG